MSPLRFAQILVQAKFIACVLTLDPIAVKPYIFEVIAAALHYLKACFRFALKERNGVC